MAVQSSRLHAKPISRKKQQSAVASAAYRSGEKLVDKRIDETFDYTRKQAVEATRIMAPSPAPAWVMDRSELWNTVEATEKRKDAQVAREVQVAIPEELPKDIREQLVWDFCQANFVDMGMIVDVAIHGPTKDNPRNWHWHGMLTMRTIGPDGFGLKERSWNENQHLERWKRNWEEACNAALEKIGSSTRVDMRSIEDRHAEQLRFAAKATSWIERMRFATEAARLNYTARPNLPQKAYRAAAKGEVYPGYKNETAEWKAAIETRGAARAKAMEMETQLDYLLGLAHHDQDSQVSDEDKIINRWLMDRFEHDPAILAIMATIADNNPDLAASACEAQAFQTFDQLGANPDHPLHDQMTVLEGVGRHILAYGWKNLTRLEQTLRNHDVMWLFNERPSTEDLSVSDRKTENSDAPDVQAKTAEMADIEVPAPATEEEAMPVSDDIDPLTADEPTAPEIVQASEQPEAAEPATTTERVSNDLAPEDRPKFRSLKDKSEEDAARRAQKAAEQAQRYQEAEDFYQDAMEAYHSTPETPAAPQETKADEKARRRAEKAAESAHAKLERPIKESRKRVLRGRTAMNLAKGAFSNLSMGRDALEPYPQSRLNLATDTFLSAAKWLANAWETYRTGDTHKPEFEREEKAYIDASETLAEMHLVVPKPKTMTGKDLIAERARLQELEDFPDQGLIAPVMGMIKKRLMQVVDYLTNTNDGRAKADDVVQKQRAQEAEEQRLYEQKQRGIEQRQRARAEESRRSTIKKVAAILDRALKDPDIYNIVASYGFTDAQNTNEIANDVSWEHVAPGTSRVAWYDLTERVRELDATRKRQADEEKLKDLARTISKIYDRSRREDDPTLVKLMRPLQINKFTDKQNVLADLRWLEPILADGERKPLWEVVENRLNHLDTITERVRQQREKAEQQKQSKPPSPFKNNSDFEP